MRTSTQMPPSPTPDASRAQPLRREVVARWAWTGLGLVCMGLGLVGVLLPVMPTTVFLLGAVACFSKGSPRLERRLLDHPRLGPALRAWRSERAIPARARRVALVSMVAAAAVVAGTAPVWVAAGVIAALALVALYVGTRPEPSPGGHLADPSL